MRSSHTAEKFFCVFRSSKWFVRDDVNLRTFFGSSVNYKSIRFSLKPDFIPTGGLRMKTRNSKEVHKWVADHTHHKGNLVRALMRAHWCNYLPWILERSSLHEYSQVSKSAHPLLEAAQQTHPWTVYLQYLKYLVVKLGASHFFYPDQSKEYVEIGQLSLWFSVFQGVSLKPFLVASVPPYEC